MKKRLFAVLLAGSMMASMLAGCGSSAQNETTEEAVEEETTEETEEETEAEETAAAEEETEAEAASLTVFAAKSLNGVLEELIAMYNETNPDVEIVGNYDSSGTLMTQIEEGAACDIFFSADRKQMNQLEEEGLVVDGTKHNVINNQVCVVTYKESGTEVTGLADLDKAANMALADGSVPVGKYTRCAMVNAGMLPETEDYAAITTQEVSDALGGLEINECANVGAVTAAVAEGSNEVGTVYYSDTHGFEDTLEVLEVVSYDLTGDVIYPVGQIVNEEATDADKAAALAFIDFLRSDEAKAVFESYYFDTNVTDD